MIKFFEKHGWNDEDFKLREIINCTRHEEWFLAPLEKVEDEEYYQPLPFYKYNSASNCNGARINTQQGDLWFGLFNNNGGFIRPLIEINKHGFEIRE